MSTQEVSPNGRPEPLSGEAKNPVCPQCQGRMTLKQVSPVLFASSFDDVVFGCNHCGTETKRTVKRA